MPTAPFPSPRRAVRGLGQQKLPWKKLLRAQRPGPWQALQNRARPLDPRDEYLQPSDPGWERLGKAHQPLATAVQQLPEAAAGSGTQALSCDPAAATLDWARAPQHRAQQQP